MYSIPDGTQTLVTYPGLYTLSKYAQKKPPNNIISDNKNKKKPHTNAALNFLIYRESTTYSYNKSLNQHHIHQQHIININNTMPPVIAAKPSANNDFESKPITFFICIIKKAILNDNAHPIEKGSLL